MAYKCLPHPPTQAPSAPSRGDPRRLKQKGAAHTKRLLEAVSLTHLPLKRTSLSSSSPPCGKFSGQAAKARGASHSTSSGTTLNPSTTVAKPRQAGLKAAHGGCHGPGSAKTGQCIAATASTASRAGCAHAGRAEQTLGTPPHSSTTAQSQF